MNTRRVADGDDTVPAATALVDTARRILERAWRPAGYTSPNLTTYPWQWLWDSCFHAIVWAHLADERALVELRTAMAGQEADGFVPHINYWGDATHAEFWNRPTTSSITQPPMFGHALAELLRLGLDPGDELIERCRRGLWHLLRERRPTDEGLVRLCHPWESGADDSPRWDHWCPGGFDHGRWFVTKGELMSSIERHPTGSPRTNAWFDVAPAGFNALVAFNGRELARATGDGELGSAIDELSARLDERWDPALDTWVDAGESATSSGRIRTADALLPVLCTADDARAARLLDVVVDRRAYGGACGPAGVHRDEPAFAPNTYWRGPAWPQLTYLLWLAARRVGRHDRADELATGARRGALRSEWAEYWNPDSGIGHGAVPQTWTTLAAIMP